MVRFNEIPGMVFVFGLIVVLGVIFSTMLGELKPDGNHELTSSDGNATTNMSLFAEEGMLNLGNYFPILGTIVILAIVVSVVIQMFRFKGNFV